MYWPDGNPWHKLQGTRGALSKSLGLASQGATGAGHIIRSPAMRSFAFQSLEEEDELHTLQHSLPQTRDERKATIYFGRLGMEHMQSNWTGPLIFRTLLSVITCVMYVSILLKYSNIVLVADNACTISILCCADILTSSLTGSARVLAYSSGCQLTSASSPRTFVARTADIWYTLNFQSSEWSML